MDHSLVPALRRTPRGALQRLRPRLGDRVECVVGCVWVTQDGDPRDVILEPGEGHVFDRAGGAIVSALADSHWLLLAPSSEPAPEKRSTGAGPSAPRAPAAS